MELDMENSDNNKAQNTDPSAQQTEKKSGRHLLLTIVIVLLISGGNGLGLIAAILLWKYTGRAWLSIGLMLAIIAAAFTSSMLILAKCNKKAGKNHD